jgi:predicted alpha/beta superfamily hydrolase
MLAECIIVGIDNSENRLTEYNYNDSEHGAGEGKQYMDFIVNTLKPFIDKNFRTNTQREHTHIAGSSMGGLISLYGAIHYAEIFGGAGIFSPSLWLTPNAADELKPLAEQNADYPQRFYFYGGAQEGENMVEHIASVAGMLDYYMHYDVHTEVDSEGTHSEFCWRNKFPDYYNWLAQGFPHNQNQ